MSYSSISGRARTSARSPRAFAVCDRCGIWYNHQNLSFQYDWRGPTLQNLWILVCPSCLDKPQEQLRAITLPPDPVPIIYARTEPFFEDEMTVMGLSSSTTDPETGIPILGTTAMSTVGGSPMTPSPIGRPNGLTQNATSPLQMVGGVPTHFGIQLDLLSVVADGTAVVTVTCRTAHGLATDDQISAEGLAHSLACGFYSVTVTTAMAFTYETYADIPAAPLLEAETIIWTVLVGLPRGYDQIPQVGP